MVKIPGVYTFGQKGTSSVISVPSTKRSDYVAQELYFFADVGNETYNIHDFVEPKPKVWS